MVVLPEPVPPQMPMINVFVCGVIFVYAVHEQGRTATGGRNSTATAQIGAEKRAGLNGKTRPYNRDPNGNSNGGPKSGRG